MSESLEKKKAPAGVNAASLRLSSEDPQGLSGFRERKVGLGMGLWRLSELREARWV